MWGCAHDFEQAIAPVIGNVLVEKIRHRIYEHQGRLFNSEGLVELVRTIGELEAVGETSGAAQALGEGLGVAPAASRRDAGATGPEIEREIRPADFGFVHGRISFAARARLAA